MVADRKRRTAAPLSERECVLANALRELVECEDEARDGVWDSDRFDKAMREAKRALRRTDRAADRVLEGRYRLGAAS